MLELKSEYLTILFGLEEYRSSFFQSIIIEIDSLLAIRKIGNGVESFSEWFSIISDIIQLAYEYGDGRFCHISRKVNECAHMLAKILSYLGE